MYTERLYRENAYTDHFTAKVMRQEKVREGFEVVLDRTAFYPTGGGQPCDTGWLDGIPVIDVEEREGMVVHLLKAPLESGTVTGKIDWKRRFDHMQQHAGQHVLSACFDKVARAGTVGFHLGSQFVYIDLNSTDLTREQVTQAEELANKTVFENLPIKTYIVQQEEVRKMPLRKQPTVYEDIRIVEIDGFDYTPCGGTHPSHTGCIGLIKVRRWEKQRDGTRIEFVCGGRALEDYGTKNDCLNRVCAMLSVRDFEAADAVERVLAENKALGKAVETMKEDLCKFEAENLVRNAPLEKGLRVIKLSYHNRPLEELRLLVSGITSEKGCIALLAATGDKNQVIAGRSEDVSIDLRKPFNEVMSQLGGRGGGSARLVQGGLGDTESAGRALDMLHSAVLKDL
ncbi:MAG TPA: alanine--tRNA ligase-related protein [Bacillota bacterium]|jgi:alanyl-tRNA synthetase|nr:alanine--tRNA ligase-related protein [Bacillota bacterium]